MPCFENERLTVNKHTGILSFYHHERECTVAVILQTFQIVNQP
jgi:hypothetical protein